MRKCRVCKDDLYEDRDGHGFAILECRNSECSAHGMQYRKKFNKWKKVPLPQEKKK